MAEKITGEQISLLEELLMELTKILTFRKIDWTHSFQNNNKKMLGFLRKSTIKGKKPKRHFEFKLEIIKPKEAKFPLFIINVEINRNVGGMYFRILEDGMVSCDFISGKECLFETLFSDFSDRINSNDITGLIKNITKEIHDQEEILSLLY